MLKGGVAGPRDRCGPDSFDRGGADGPGRFEDLPLKVGLEEGDNYRFVGASRGVSLS